MDLEEDEDEIISSPPPATATATATPAPPPPPPPRPRRLNQYEDQKRRDWASFVRFLSTRQPRLTPSRVRSSHVIEFLDSVQYSSLGGAGGGGKTLVHTTACPYFGCSHPPAPCPCPRRHSWGSLDALVGRLRAACEDCPARPETNPFGVRAVRDYLLRVKDEQATARGIPYSRSKRQRTTTTTTTTAAHPDPVNNSPLPECSTATAAAAAAATAATATAAYSAGSTRTSAAAEEDISGAQMEDPPPPPPPPPDIANNHVDDCSPPPPPPPPPPPGIDPLATRSIGEDLAAQLQFCWVRPPVSDGQSTPPFYPIWRYPTLESLVPFLSPLPYMPTTTSQRAEENETRFLKQEVKDHASMVTLETREEGNQAGGSDPSQASAEHPTSSSQQRNRINRYEEQKKRDWSTFLRFMENHQPRLTLSRVRGPHVIEFLKSIDQFGKTLIHVPGCPYFGNPKPAAPCACPLCQSWGSLDALVGRLRASCEESSNRPETNPFGVRAVRNYLLQVKDNQATARGIPYSRKRKRNLPTPDTEPFQASDGVLRDGAESGSVAAFSNPYMAGEQSGDQFGDSSTYEEDSFTTTDFAGFASTSVVMRGSDDPPTGFSSAS